MDVQDQSTHALPAGHEQHGVHLCRRCGWPFPNPHPSARHRRAHKKICGSIEGYTNLIDSGVVSDDEHHPDDESETNLILFQGPEIEKAKKNIKESGGDGGIGRRSSRSEDDLFSDAVTEFSDSGTSPGLEDRSAGNQGSNKTLDRDMFFSFKDAENGGGSEALTAPVEISKVDTSLTGSEKLDTHVTKNGETTVLDSSEMDGKCDDGLIKDGSLKSTPQENDLSRSQEAESIHDVVTGEQKVQESLASETDENVVPSAVAKEAKEVEVQDSEASKPVTEVSATSGYGDHGERENLNVVSDVKESEPVSEVIKESEIDQRGEGISDEIKHEKFESDHERVPEVVKDSEIDQRAEVGEEIKHEKFESDHAHAPEVVKDSEIDQRAEVGEEIKHENFETDHEHAQEVVKDCEIDQRAEVGEETEHEKIGFDHEHALGVVKEPETDQSVSVLTEKVDLDSPELEKCSKEPTQEVVNEPESVLTETVDIGAPKSEECSTEPVQEVVKEPESVLTETVDTDSPELEKCSKEPIQEVVKDPESVLTETVDIAAPKSEKCLKEPINEPEPIQEAVSEPRPIQEAVSEPKPIQEAVNEPESVLTETVDNGAPNSEKCSKEQIQEVVKEPESVLTGSPNSEKCSNERIQDVVDVPISVFTENEYLGAAQLEKRLKEPSHKVFKEPEPEPEPEPNTFLTEKGDLGAPNIEKRTNEHTPQLVEKPDSVLTEKEDLGAPVSVKCSNIQDPNVDYNSNIDIKNASRVVSEPIIEEGNGKLKTNQDSGVDLSVDSSSRNSLEGNWGSVSVLSTASIDTETVHTVDKSKVNSRKSDSRSDVFEPPSFMPEPKPEPDQKSGAEVPDSRTHVSNESEGRKRNEEVIAKVTNWSTATGKPSTPLKNLLGDAKLPQPGTVVQKDENEAATEKPSEARVGVVNQDAGAVNKDVSSPPKLIDEGNKKDRKSKGKGSWMPFGCCSSVNVVN